jgi:hypothetical protein
LIDLLPFLSDPLPFNINNCSSHLLSSHFIRRQSISSCIPRPTCSLGHGRRTSATLGPCRSPGRCYMRGWHRVSKGQRVGRGRGRRGKSEHLLLVYDYTAFL